MRRHPGLLVFTCAASLLATGLWLPLKAMLARDWPLPGWSGTPARTLPPQAFVQPVPERVRETDGSAGMVLPAPGITVIAVPARPDAESRDTVARL